MSALLALALAAALRAGEPIDPCALLLPAEVATVQGEGVRETRAHRQAAGGLVRLSCFYTLPTFSRSVSLELTVAEDRASGGAAARKWWDERFAERDGVAAAEEREGEAKAGKEEEGGRPLRVDEVGEQGFWVGSHLSGALYVLQGDAVLRISLGGGDEGTLRVEHARRLAHEAVQRLADANAPRLRATPPGQTPQRVAVRPLPAP